MPLPVATAPVVLDAVKHGQTFVDVLIDTGELSRRTPVTNQ
jgi:hypothetical protein